MKKKLLQLFAISGMLVATGTQTNAQWTRDAVNGYTYATFPTDKIGIGTNTPSYQLDIKQPGVCSFRIQSQTTGSANLILSRSTAAGQNCLVNYKTGTADLWRTGVSGNNTDFNIINAGGTSAITVLQANNFVGIGITAPTVKLDVDGNIKSNGNIFATGGNSTQWNTAYSWGNHATAGYLTAETDPQVGVNTTNYASKWDGTALVASTIFNNGTFTGINATSGIGSAQLVVGNTNASYGGMYINSSGTVGSRKPFYGYSLSGAASCWTYYDEATSSFRIYNSGDRFTVDNQGQVGIGTTAPAYYLDIEASTTYRALNAVSNYVGNVSQVVNFGRTNIPSTGNDIVQITVPAGSPDDFQFIEADQAGVVKFAVNGDGRTGIGASALTNVGLNVAVGSDAAGTGAGGYIVSGNAAGLNVAMDNNEIMARNNSAVSTLYLNDDGGNISMCTDAGQVSIGIGTPATGYLLSVDGKIIAEEVRVELSGNWPDYVFEKEHNLLSIDELEQHVNQYKHLPGVPTACEIEEGGIMLGDMQSKTMEKVEENALYIIQLNKKLEDQNSLIQKLIKEIEVLKNNK